MSAATVERIPADIAAFQAHYASTLCEGLAKHYSEVVEASSKLKLEGKVRHVEELNPETLGPILVNANNPKGILLHAAAKGYYSVVLGTFSHRAGRESLRILEHTIRQYAEYYGLKVSGVPLVNFPCYSSDEPSSPSGPWRGSPDDVSTPGYIVLRGLPILPAWSDMPIMRGYPFEFEPLIPLSEVMTP